MTKTTDLDPRFNAFRPDLADISLKPFVKASKYVEPVLRQCVRGIAPLFEKPDTSSLRLSEIRYGEFLDVYEQRKDGFAWVQSRNDRFVGYIRKDDALTEVIAALMNRINVPSTFVYAAPDLAAPVLDRITLGSFVSLDGEEGNFYPLASGGFVFKRHVAPADEVECTDYVFTAGQLVNVPFLTGGRSTMGMDSSGLLQFALDLAGIDAPRALDQQLEMFGRPLPCHWRDVVWTRGDLVFFGGPDHAGIMTGVDHILSASPHHMTVTVEPLAELMARGHHITGAGKPS